MLKLLIVSIFLGCSSFSNIPIISNNKNIAPLRTRVIAVEQCKPELEIVRKIIPRESHDELVKSITSFLPKVDGVGGFVLHMNDVLINKILHIELLSPEIKKSLILTIINISQIGDAAGHNILQLYYDIVDCLL